MFYPTIIDTIGKTPVVELQNTEIEFKHKIFVKLEFCNPGGSHKTRVGFNMIKSAEKAGLLSLDANHTIIEPTGGNTGIGLAIAGSLLGYKVKLVMPDNFSKLKQKLLKSYGADVVLSDSSTGNGSHIALTKKLLNENRNYVFLDQFSNPANPDIHEQTTGPEIDQDLGAIDFLVGGIGSGGSLSGVGKFLKSKNTNIKIIGVQPDNCDLLNGVFKAHKIESIAVGVIPKNLNVDILDKIISVNESEVFKVQRELAIKEGLNVGISSAANIVACLTLAKSLVKPAKIVTFAYDSGVFYLS